jgi:hypothetical protein
VSGGAVLDLSEGREVFVSGVCWTVARFEPERGRVVLQAGDGSVRQTTIRALANDPDCAQAGTPGGAPAARAGRQPATLKDLTPAQRAITAVRFGHLLEVETGFRSGDPLRAAAGEPRAAYDPATTTLTGRRHAKAAELRALTATEPEHARVLGLDKMSYITIVRQGLRVRRFGQIGCADDRWLRPAIGPGRDIAEAVREAVHAVRAETLHRSAVSMKTRERLIHQYVRERHGPDVPVPGYDTLRRIWRDWFGAGGSRQRYVRSAAVAAANATGEHVTVYRPGQIVALDTTALPVLVRETVLGEAVEAHLTLALDLYSHSLVAFRLTLVSDTSVDVAMLLRDVMTPLPMRPGWGENMAWPYPGVPEALVSDLAGYPVAGLPFFAPETVTTDHGSVYKNHHLVEVQRVIGARILPARVLRPTDKHAVERAFGGIQSLLFEALLGYRGVDVADRGADPAGDAVLTLAQMEHAIATWIVGVWQNRLLGEYRPCWDPGGDHSPNTLFAAAMAQGGFALQIPKPELYYELLPAHNVRIDPVRGVKIRGLWYCGDAVAGRAQHSTRGGAHQRQWVVRSDKRDRRQVYFQDPDTGVWHTLRWSGLPPEGEVPSFNDARVGDLLAEARARGLRPKTDTELLPLLLELLGADVPVDRWPTQLTRVQRKAQAREAAQSAAQVADQGRGTTDDEAASAACDPRDRAGGTVTALDAERRRRREAAVTGTPTPPPRLGDQLRRRSLLLVPDDPEPDPDTEGRIP